MQSSTIKYHIFKVRYTFLNIEHDLWEENVRLDKQHADPKCEVWSVKNWIRINRFFLLKMS